MPLDGAVTVVNHPHHERSADVDVFLGGNHGAQNQCVPRGSRAATGRSLATEAIRPRVPFAVGLLDRVPAVQI